MAERGKYIVIEGSDGTGKSVQSIETSRHLDRLGYNNLLVWNDETGQMEPVQEPGGTPIANKIRKKIKDKTIPRTPWENVQWFTEARQSIWNDAIKPALDSGLWVVTARSWISTVAYQGYGEGVDIDAIREYTREMVGEEYMNPDLVCILALQNERIRRQRIIDRSGSDDSDTFESMPEEFQTNMQSGYVRFAEDNGTILINASKPKKDVQRDLWSHVSKLI